MSTRWGTFSCSVVALALGIGVAASASGQVEGAWAQPDDNLFPSLVIATSTLRPERIKELSATTATPQQKQQSQSGDAGSKAEKILKALAEGIKQKQQSPAKKEEAKDAPGTPPILGVTVKTSKPGTRVHLTILATQFFDESTSDDVLPDAGHTYQVHPAMRWNFKALGENDQQTPLNVTFKVKVDDGEEQQIVKTITVRSIRDCPHYWTGQFGNPSPVDVSWMFAAYVNEDHPWIDTLLHESMEQGMVDNFVGQQWGPDQVMQQVFAIWHTLQRRGFKYSDIATTPDVGRKVFSQDVRTFEDCLSTAQGNCIDGTAVFASLLRKVGIEPYIMLIPGHAFLAFRVNDGKAFHVYGLETTMIGNTDIRSEANPIRANYMSAASFCSAIQEGTKKLADAAKVIDSGKPHPGYELLPVSIIRDIGIAPLPSRATRDIALPPSSDKVTRKKNPAAVPKIGGSGGLKLSLAASYRNALAGPGLVLTLRNQYPWSIQATVAKLDAKGAPIKAARINLPADGTGEVGHAEGIAWSMGDQVLVEAQGYEPYRVHIGK